MLEKAEIEFVGTVESVDGEEVRVQIFSKYCEALKGIDDFSHIIILYWIHLRNNRKHRSTLKVVPRRHTGNVEVGVFACRSPSRPNPIGLCVAELVQVKDCILTVKGLDAFAGSPIVDIKPYIPRADSVPHAQVPEWTNRGPST